MQQPLGQRRTLPPQGLAGAGMPPPQGLVGGGFAAAVAAATQAKAEEAARARVAEQMAIEDAWKALNPDFATPFASVEDAVSRLLPYHVFADYEEDDDGVVATGGNNSGGAAVTEVSSAQNGEDNMEARVEDFLAHFEKQVLTFNVMNRQRAEGFDRGEERLILEMALYEDERRQTERVREAIAQHQQQQQQLQQQQEEAGRARLALAQAQARATGAWPGAQPTSSWQALAAAARGEGGSGGQALAPSMVMQQQPPQQEVMMTAGVWQALAAVASCGDGSPSGQALVQAVMMQHMQQQQQQRRRQDEMMMAAASRGEGAPGGQALAPALVMQLLQQQQQQRQQEDMMAAASRHDGAPNEQALAPAAVMRQLQQQQEEMMAAGAWQMHQLGGRQTYAGPRGDGNSSGQAVLQQPAQGQDSGAAARMALPWRGSAERRKQ